MPANAKTGRGACRLEDTNQLGELLQADGDGVDVRHTEAPGPGDLALVRQDEQTLKAQDVVIVSPLASVTDGMPVSVASDAPKKTSVLSEPSTPSDAKSPTDTADSSSSSQQEVKP